MAAFSAHSFSSYRMHHPLSSSSSPPLATSPALSSSFIVNHCQLVPPWPNLWCYRRRVSDLPFLPIFPSMPPVTTHFFCLRFLLCDAIDVILIVVALLCCGDALPPPSSSSPSPSAPAPLCHHRRDQIAATAPPYLPPLPQLPRKHCRCCIPSPLRLPFLRPLAAAMISKLESEMGIGNGKKKFLLLDKEQIIRYSIRKRSIKQTKIKRWATSLLRISKEAVV